MKITFGTNLDINRAMEKWPEMTQIPPKGARIESSTGLWLEVTGHYEIMYSPHTKETICRVELHLSSIESTLGIGAWNDWYNKRKVKFKW